MAPVVYVSTAKENPVTTIVLPLKLVKVNIPFSNVPPVNCRSSIEVQPRYILSEYIALIGPSQAPISTV